MAPTAPVEAPRASAEPTHAAEPVKHPLHRAAPAEGEGKPSSKLGEVYVFASSGSYEVILRERIVKAPALLELPVDTAQIGVRKQGESAVRQVKVSPQPGRPMMMRIDL